VDLVKTAPRWIDSETGVVHADGGDGNDYVLCGDAMDGENGDAFMIETVRHKITCSRCIRVIVTAKAIHSSLIGKAADK